MNIQNEGSMRPKLYPPKALLATGPGERRTPMLTRPELRSIVIAMLG
jgi:hypothetical protein